MNTTTNIDEQVKQILRKQISICCDKEFDIFIVWKCKTLQHCKWLMATTLPDNLYYELTYNGDKDEIYIDEYDKIMNVCVPQPFKLKQ